jgi:hypothetical protein
VEILPYVCCEEVLGTAIFQHCGLPIDSEINRTIETIVWGFVWYVMNDRARGVNRKNPLNPPFVKEENEFVMCLLS